MKHDDQSNQDELIMVTDPSLINGYVFITKRELEQVLEQSHNQMLADKAAG